MSSKTLKLVVPVLVIIAGFAAAAVITSARKAPPRVDRPALGPLVEVLPVEITAVPVVVAGHGEVVAKVSVDIVPQVAGQVVKTGRRRNADHRGARRDPRRGHHDRGAAKGMADEHRRCPMVVGEERCRRHDVVYV